MQTKLVRLGVKALEMEFEQGDSLGMVLSSYEISVDFESEGVFQAGKAIQENELNSVPASEEPIIIARGVRGEAPTPLYRTAIRYLRQRDYVEHGGKGDHKKFTARNGSIVILNSDKRDKKHLDMGSAKSLAKHLGVSFGKLHEMLN